MGIAAEVGDVFAVAKGVVEGVFIGWRVFSGRIVEQGLIFLDGQILEDHLFNMFQRQIEEAALRTGQFQIMAQVDSLKAPAASQRIVFESLGVSR